MARQNEDDYDDYDDDVDDYEDDRPRRKSRGGRLSRSQLEEAKSKKLTAGLCGILIGGFAVHKFVLGYTNTAILQLVLSVFTCGAVGIIGLIEGIIYLTKDDEEFYDTYIAGKKEWF